MQECVLLSAETIISEIKKGIYLTEKESIENKIQKKQVVL